MWTFFFNLLLFSSILLALKGEDETMEEYAMQGMQSDTHIISYNLLYQKSEQTFKFVFFCIYLFFFVFVAKKTENYEDEFSAVVVDDEEDTGEYDEEEYSADVAYFDDVDIDYQDYGAYEDDSCMFYIFFLLYIFERVSLSLCFLCEFLQICANG